MLLWRSDFRIDADRLMGSLASVFPAYIATTAVRAARFDSNSSSTEATSKNPGLLEAGVLVKLNDEAAFSIKVGAGQLEVGTELRQLGWEGTVFERVKSWLRRIFALSRK